MLNKLLIDKVEFLSSCIDHIVTNIIRKLFTTGTFIKAVRLSSGK